MIPLRYPFRGSGHPVEAVERRPHAAATAGTLACEVAWKGGGHGMPAAGLTAPSAALRTSVMAYRLRHSSVASALRRRSMFTFTRSALRT